MTGIVDFLLEKNDVLRPFGQLDVLGYYAAVSGKLRHFLGQREIATKIWIPDGPTLLKRGSLLRPLTAGEIVDNVDEDFLGMRAKIKSLPAARGKFPAVKERIWEYFFLHKLCDFFYAANFEGQGKKMGRIFYDIDRGPEFTVWDAARVAASLLEHIRSDDEFGSAIGKNIQFAMFTGSSFHIYLLLKKPIEPASYDSHIQFSEKDPGAGFTARWAEKISAETGIRVRGGHEKTRGAINIDPSQTPSGKLARCPLSLHMGDAKTVDEIGRASCRERV